jgi:hypothetical protein
VTRVRPARIPTDIYSGMCPTAEKVVAERMTN